VLIPRPYSSLSIRSKISKKRRATATHINAEKEFVLHEWRKNKKEKACIDYHIARNERLQEIG